MDDIEHLIGKEIKLNVLGSDESGLLKRGSSDAYMFENYRGTRFLFWPEDVDDKKSFGVNVHIKDKSKVLVLQ